LSVSDFSIHDEKLNYQQNGCRDYTPEGAHAVKMIMFVMFSEGTIRTVKPICKLNLWTLMLTKAC